MALICACDFIGFLKTFSPMFYYGNALILCTYVQCGLLVNFKRSIQVRLLWLLRLTVRNNRYHLSLDKLPCDTVNQYCSY